MRNSGSVIGGAINFSTNNTQSSAGGIAWATYLIFVGFGEISSVSQPSKHLLTRVSECTGVIWAVLLSPTQRVRRNNGTKVPMSGKISWKQEFIALGKHFTYKKVNIYLIPFLFQFSASN